MGTSTRWWRDYIDECLAWLATLPTEHVNAILVGQFGNECTHGLGHALCDEPVDFVGLYRRMREVWLWRELFNRPICPHCDEPVMPWDPARQTPHLDAHGKASKRTWHRECLLRGVVGSVGHLQRKCSCYGGTEEDPPGMSKREAAIAAVTMAGLQREVN